MKYNRSCQSLSLFVIIVILILSCSICVVGDSLPHGQVVYSAQVSRTEYTHDGGRFDLFMQMVPNGKVIRLTNHQAYPKQNLGGAIREPVFSQNGKDILFLADYSNSDERRITMTGASPYPYTLLNVWRITLSSRSIIPITKGELGWHDISWSPDNQLFSVVYPSRSGVIDQDTIISDDIYVYTSSKIKMRKIARVAKNVSDIFWSSDSQNILFQLWSDPSLYITAHAGGKPKVLIKGKGDRFGYSFSPNGQHIAFIQDDIVYTANANGCKAIPAIKPSKTGAKVSWPRPQWSSDSQSLAAGEVSFYSAGNYYKTSLHVYNQSAHCDEIITTVDEKVTSIEWSKNRKWLILKILRTGQIEQPDIEAGWYHCEGLLAVSIADGKIVTLKETNEETKGLDWVEAQ